MIFQPYYRLTKPGIIYGNLLAAIAGYLLACRLHVFWPSLIGMVFGLALVIAAACVLNNLADRDIDAQMMRTKTRPSATGEISFNSGLIYAGALAGIGFALLLALTDTPCVLFAALGLVVYVLAYTYLKRETHYATLIGSISGATPIVSGYLAYSDHLTSAAIIIGLMMVAWQLTHFYSIALYRSEEYQAAKIPVLPLVTSKKRTMWWMVFFSFAFLGLAISLYFYAPMGIGYLVIMCIVGATWLGFNCYGLFSHKINDWARKDFLASLGVVLVMSVAIALR